MAYNVDHKPSALEAEAQEKKGGRGKKKNGKKRKYSVSGHK